MKETSTNTPYVRILTARTYCTKHKQDAKQLLAPQNPASGGEKTALKGVPRCPFLSQKGSKSGKVEKFEKTKVKDEAYSGLGHKEGSLSFFPFSAGERSCPARTLGLQVIRKVRVRSDEMSILRAGVNTGCCVFTVTPDRLH